MNKTCYNGLYRVNSKGEFNVPFGDYKNPKICDEIGLRTASIHLQQANLKVADFETVLTYAEKGDLIYLDPPYEPLTSTSNFTSYTSVGFNSDEQRRLAGVFKELDYRGCFVMLSNSNTTLIKELYADYYQHTIVARRNINSDPNGRGELPELVITNYTNNSKKIYSKR